MAAFFDFSNCLDSVNNNIIYGTCCQRITCNVTNVHNTDLTITDLTVFCSDWNTNLISINGNSPAFPIVVNENSSFQIVFDICSTNFSDSLKIVIQTLEHRDPEFYTFPFSVWDFSNDYTPNTIDFGTVAQFTPSAPQTITITNSTSYSVDYDWENFTCPNEIVFTNLLGTPFSFPVTIAAGGNFVFNAIWTPTGPNEDLAGCNTDLQVLNADDSVCLGQKLEFFGLSTEGECQCLCLDLTLIQTPSYGSTLNYLDDVAIAGTSSFVYTTSAICEKKRITYFFNYVNGIDNGFKVWFNPWMFAFTCDFNSFYPSSVNAPPPQGWFIEFNSSTMSIGGVYPMNLIGTGSNQFNQTNFNVYFAPTNFENFQIQIDFFQIEDIENWIANSTLANNPKWRRNSVNAPNPSMGSNYQNLIGSVYNANKKLCSLTYVVDPNTIVDEQPTECFVNHSLNYTSRFYNLGLYNGVSEFTGWTTPLPTFELERTVGMVNNFSTIEKTKVVFKCNVPIPIYGGLGECVFQLFEETGTDDTVDFLTNYDSSRAEIQTIGGTGILNNHIVRPSVKALLGSVGDCALSAYVDTTVLSTGKYRLAAIVYSRNKNMVNTFISEQILVTNLPDFACDVCEIQTNSTFNQYFNTEISNCIQPTLKERIQHLVTISRGSFINCLNSWGADLSFEQYMNRITLNIYYKNAAFPTPTQTTFFMFGQHISNRVAGFPFGWQNLNDMIVKDVSGGITTEFMTRVRWENTPFDGSNVFVANTNTFMNRTNVGALGNTYVSTLGINNNWSNAMINFEYVYQFDLSPIFGVPYIVNQVKTFYVQAIPNEPNISPIDSHLTGFRIEGQLTNGGVWNEIQNPFCPNDFVGIRVRYESNIDGDFIFFMEPYLGGNVNNIMESEFNPSPNLFPQLLNVPSLSADFSTFEAFAELDISNLGNGQYIVCGYLSLK